VSGDESSRLELILRRDRIIGLVALLLFIAFAWWYLLHGAGMPDDMSSMSGMDMDMGAPRAWTAGYASIVFVMWWVMMIAMMLPSAAPMILLYGLVSRHQEKRGATAVGSGIFLLGYLTVWGAFSGLATTLQWQLQKVALMSPAMAITSAVAGGLILIAAGLYQLTPLRDACLQHCRGPMEFVSRHWMPGAAGAWKMGIRHGLHCLGCCWMLMALLFYGGVMNLYWIIGLTVYIFLEKLVPRGMVVSRLASVVLIVWGALVLAGAAGVGA
jgi:predicted metal-binding membrane protein